MREPAPFPWDEATAFGLGVLGLSPDAFWAATPLELAAAHRGRHGRLAPGFDRAALDALARAFPDHP